jgi:hypothetical protein
LERKERGRKDGKQGRRPERKKNKEHWEKEKETNEYVQQTETLGVRTVNLIKFRRLRPKQRLTGMYGHTWCVGSLGLHYSRVVKRGGGGNDHEVYCDRNHLPFTP